MRVLLAMLVGGLLVCGALGAPTITSLSTGTTTRSGRVLVVGSGFGDPRGTSNVLVGGVPALITRWSDVQITAYVPESAPVGVDDVQVVGSGGSSNLVPLNVGLRRSNGKVLWRFQADSDYILQRPAVAADGTVVAHDSAGFVYSLSKDGALKWIFRTPLFAYGPPSIGADGTAYVASGNIVYALAADGTLKWSFDGQPGGQGIIAGPSVGPDGNVYAVTDVGGLGAFSLDPAGHLRWSNLGTQTISELGQIGAEVVFGPAVKGGPVDRLYVAFDDFATSTDARHHLYAFSFDGVQQWIQPIYQSKDSFMQSQPQPAVGPDGTVYENCILPVGGNWSANAFSPATGAVLRSFFPTPGNGMSAPDVASDGALYYLQSLSYLQGLQPNGSLKWTFFDGSIMLYPIVSPTNTLVVVGGAPNFGVSGFFRAFAAGTGQLAFSVNLGSENGGNLNMQSRTRFAVDGSAAYFGTVITGSTNPDVYCYLYAIDTSVAKDIVAIQSAQYTVKRKQLKVAATSTNPKAVLTVYVTATGAKIGVMSTAGNGRYTGTFPWPTYPANITVRSSFGGSATKALTRR